MSRYSTFSADSQSPNPNASAAATMIGSGSQISVQESGTEYQTYITSTSASVTAMSTIPASTDDAGTIMRGKYTFEIRCALPIRLLLELVRPVEKNVHGTSAAMTKSEYGMPW